MIHSITGKTALNDRTKINYFVKSGFHMAETLCRHEFYEILLITSGTLRMNLCGQEMEMSIGNMALIRPGDVHSKSGEGGAYIELTFSRDNFEDLISYLGCEEQYEEFLKLPVVAPILMKHQEFLEIRNRMEMIGGIPAQDRHEIQTSLRMLLFEIYVKYYKKNYHEEAGGYKHIPEWLAEAIGAWHTPENRQKGLDFFCEYTGFSKEHICRTFKNYMGTSPTSYLNSQRLKYAVALMRNSKYSVIDIAFEAGFKSSSRFYQVFKDAYGVSPREFCSQGRDNK